MEWHLIIPAIIYLIAGEVFINATSDEITLRNLGGILMALGGCVLTMAIIAY